MSNWDGTGWAHILLTGEETRTATVSSIPAYQETAAYAWGRPSPALGTGVRRNARDTTEKT